MVYLFIYFFFGKVSNMSKYHQNVSFPMVKEEGELVIAKCQRYTNISQGNETEGCLDGWWYDRDVMRSSVVTEVSGFSIVKSAPILRCSALPFMVVLFSHYGVKVPRWRQRFKRFKVVQRSKYTLFAYFYLLIRVG